MAINVQCPNCNRTLGVPDNLLGKKVKCPSCQTIFTAEEPGGAPPPPPPPMEEDAPARPSRRRDEGDDEGRGRAVSGSDAIRAKVNMPGIALMIHGGLGLLGALLGFAVAIIAVAATDGRAQEDAIPGAIFWGCDSLLAVPLSVLVIFGAMRMRSLQSWGLAMAASIAGMFVMPPCCCWLGIGFGIWSIIVLNNAEVKAAFR